MRNMIVSAAALFGFGYILSRKKRRAEPYGRTAFRRFDDGGPIGQAQPIRDADVAAMRDEQNAWSRRDDELDQTFPASDATAKY